MSTKPDFDFEFSHVQELPIEFYEPFRKAEEDTAARIQRLQFERMEALMGETNCQREASTWAMRANGHRKRVQSIDDELRTLGVGS